MAPARVDAALVGLGSRWTVVFTETRSGGHRERANGRTVAVHATRLSAVSVESPQLVGSNFVLRCSFSRGWGRPGRGSCCALTITMPIKQGSYIHSGWIQRKHAPWFAIRSDWRCVGCRLTAESHPAGGQGLWGSEAEVPSFLYAMPMQGGTRVFLEETCLVAKPALPFAVLKRRLERRLRASGIKVRCHTFGKHVWGSGRRVRFRV